MNSFQINGYQIRENSLGSGCSGEVFRARHESDDEQYVVKRYNSMSIDRNLMGDISCRIRNSPSHPGIIPITECRFDATPYYSVCPYDSGKKLTDCSQFEQSHAIDLIAALADTLAHAHKYGIVHGNLHPGNIFYHFDEGLNLDIRIGDFGAGMIGEVHYVDLEETAYYAAPEQLQCLGSDYKFGKAEKWDVYRFGAIAFWISTQRLSRGVAYQKSRAHDIAESGGRPVPVDPYALAEVMSHDLRLAWGEDRAGDLPYQKVIERCLNLNPDDRPFDMQEVKREFDAAIEEIAAIKADEKLEFEKKSESPVEGGTPGESIPVQISIPLPPPQKVKKKRFVDWFRTEASQDESSSTPHNSGHSG